MLLLAGPRRIRRIRSLGHSLHRLATAESSEKETLGFTPGASFFISFPHGKSLTGAFFFVASALTDLSSARLTTCALNTVRKQAFYNGSVVAVANCFTTLHIIDHETRMISRHAITHPQRLLRATTTEPNVPKHSKIICDPNT